MGTFVSSAVYIALEQASFFLDSWLTEFSTDLNYMHISRSITVIDNSFAENPAQTLD